MNVVIPKIQNSYGSYKNNWLFVNSLGDGTELIIYFVFHMVWTAKFHRAFLTSIMIATNFFFTNSL